MKNHINVNEVVFREDLYPRITPDPVKIQQYSESIEMLPPIEVSKHRRQFPVDEDGWIMPRKHRRWNSGSHMSGTPFKYFDFSSFNRLDTALNKPLSLVESSL